MLTHEGWVKEKNLLIVKEIGYALHNLKPGVIINHYIYS